MKEEEIRSPLNGVRVSNSLFGGMGTGACRRYSDTTGESVVAAADRIPIAGIARRATIRFAVTLEPG